MITGERAGQRRRRGLAAIAVVLVLVGAAVLGIDLLEPGVGGPSAPASGSASGSTPAGAATTPAATPLPTSSPAPRTSPQPSAVPSAGAPTPAPTTLATAPTSEVGFRVRATVVPMGFPLPASARYRYGDAWRTPRAGVVYPYNQIRGVTSAGRLLRAHDGLDLQVALGTAVLAPFSGVVVDPRPLWRPWDQARFGRVVVIRSSESTSPGYLVILAHLSRQSVSIGDTVRRGQVVGRTGRTGNAAGTVPHLHVELRAPFLIRYAYAGVARRLDVFDVEPSLRAADPRSR